MLYLTNPYKSRIPTSLLCPMWGSLLQCWSAGAINLELPLYGLPPTSFIHWLILPLTTPSNWNPCDNSHNSLAVKRRTSWPNPVEVNALIYSVCDIQFNWLQDPFDITLFKTVTAVPRVVLQKSCKGKAIPLQAWSGPEGSRSLRFPDIMTTAQEGGKVVSLTHRPHLPPGNPPGTHFC